jgi:hypothetical protein
MFCPRYGYEFSSDRVRFCTQCRFPVGSMKEFIATEAARYESGEEKESSSPRQVDITVGASLMIGGVIISMITALAFTNKFLFAGVTAFLSVFVSLFTLFLLFSKSSSRRRGLSLGATLVFIFNLIATIFAQPTDGISFFIVAAIAIPVILIWTRITRFFFGVDTKPRKSGLTSGELFLNVAGTSVEAAIPLVQGHTTAGLNNQQERMEEMNERFSVTENWKERRAPAHKSLRPRQARAFRRATFLPRPSIRRVRFDNRPDR